MARLNCVSLGRNATSVAALVGILIGLFASISPAKAETRRAFLIGNQRYTDGYLQPLTRTMNDAKDLAKDLEDAGFDKKNIKVVTDIKNKSAFDKEFDAFLKTVEAGDFVLFYFSGHGFGVEAQQNNYLLFTDLRSPFTYTKTQLTDSDRRNPDVVRLRVPGYLDAYEQNEIPQSGVSVTEIERKISEKRPKNVFMILDACRSLVRNEADQNEAKLVIRGSTSGSRLLTGHKPPPGFLLLYSAQFGEQALEGVSSSDSGRNSLFTEVLRAELMRPGQSVLDLANRVKLMVRTIALEYGWQQEPEFVAAQGSIDAEEIMLIGSIGRERFKVSQDKCDGENVDWEQIKKLHKRELLERHRRRYSECRTAEFARQEIARLALVSEDPVEPPAVSANRSISDCDRLAASELDSARPPEVPGVPFDRVDADDAIAACVKAVSDNPRITRYLFNLGRAYQKLGLDPGRDEDDRKRALRSARLSYDDASKRGYVSALTNLSVLYEAGDGVERDDQAAVDMLKRAADQGHPLAMYNLGTHYQNGNGVKRDVVQATEYFAKSAEAGFVSAMVELGFSLTRGLGAMNPRRGVEWLQRAADAGSNRAKFWLGYTYLKGAYDTRSQNSINSVPADAQLALLWIGRMADSGDGDAQALLAGIMQYGRGLPSPQPEIAERYWRLAAYGGNAYAEVTFADRLRSGFVLVKQEYGSQEAITLLQRAMAQGSAQAALALAQIYRTGELGQDKSPVNAMKLAYKAIELATLTETTPKAGEPFPEMGAAHLLVEMAKNNEAVDTAGRQLLTADEIGRLERYYGKVDPATGQVNIRRLSIKLSCAFVRSYDRRKRQWVYLYTRDQPAQLWVWDWGRNESPTEFQFRNLERDTRCTDNDLLRRTMIDIFEQAKKSKVAFADLVDQKVRTAYGQSVESKVKSSSEPRRGRRHRRW